MSPPPLIVPHDLLRAVLKGTLGLGPVDLVAYLLVDVYDEARMEDIARILSKRGIDAWACIGRLEPAGFVSVSSSGVLACISKGSSPTDAVREVGSSRSSSRRPLGASVAGEPRAPEPTGSTDKTSTPGVDIRERYQPGTPASTRHPQNGHAGGSHDIVTPITSSGDAAGTDAPRGRRKRSRPKAPAQLTLVAGADLPDPGPVDADGTPAYLSALVEDLFTAYHHGVTPSGHLRKPSRTQVIRALRPAFTGLKSHEARDALCRTILAGCVAYAEAERAAGPEHRPFIKGLEVWARARLWEAVPELAGSGGSAAVNAEGRVVKTKTYLEQAKGMVPMPETDRAKVEAARRAWRKVDLDKEHSDGEA